MNQARPLNESPGPRDHYQQALQLFNFIADPAQARAVEHTQRLYENLLRCRSQNGWKELFVRKSAPVKGLYFHGLPGRGKTWLMDCFYACLPFEQKHRLHFHQFMRDIHQRLKILPHSPDPLRIIAADLAKNIRILCLDEFHVHDIADAMLLAGLLKALFDNGVTLMATSNTAINDLYKNGLQRERFMYAIELLQQHTQEIVLDGREDYRLAQLEQNQSYRVLAEEEMAGVLEPLFNKMAPSTPKHNRQVEINDRPIDYLALADDLIWFDFDAICNTPRSTHDYLELARLYHTVFISKVYPMYEKHDSVAKRFIHLVDALYDHNVKLIIAAQVPMEDLYQGRMQTEAFERTFSRLHEMGGKSYMARPHLMR